MKVAFLKILFLAIIFLNLTSVVLKNSDKYFKAGSAVIKGLSPILVIADQL